MAPILFLFFVAAVFAALLIGISVKFAPKERATQVKASSYECGLAPDPPPSRHIPVKFYRTAILFIIFDIEIIFMYPFALAYRDFLERGQGPYILLVMGIFLGLFLLGLWWEIASKALKWT